jgi:uncharacterized protein (DUF779 family)
MQLIDSGLHKYFGQGAYLVLQWSEGPEETKLQLFEVLKTSQRLISSVTATDEGIAELIAEAQKNSRPIIFHVSGKAVINSRDLSKSYDNETFIWQQHKWREQVVYGICRKEYIEGLIHRLTGVTDAIVKLYIGDLQDRDYSDPQASQEAKTITATDLVKHHLMDPFKEDLDVGFAEYLHRRFYGWYLRAASIVWLSVVVISAALFMWFSQETSVLEEKAFEIQNTQQLIKKTEAQVQVLRKKYAVESSYFAYFLDDMGATVPSAVQLDEIVIGVPYMETATRTEVIDLQQVEIRGTTTDIKTYIDWLAVLQALPQVQSNSGGEIDQSGSTGYSFYIKIKLN